MFKKICILAMYITLFSMVHAPILSAKDYKVVCSRKYKYDTVKVVRPGELMFELTTIIPEAMAGATVFVYYEGRTSKNNVKLRTSTLTMRNPDNKYPKEYTPFLDDSTFTDFDLALNGCVALIRLSLKVRGNNLQYLILGDSLRDGTSDHPIPHAKTVDSLKGD